MLKILKAQSLTKPSPLCTSPRKQGNARLHRSLRPTAQDLCHPL